MSGQEPEEKYAVVCRRIAQDLSRGGGSAQIQFETGTILRIEHSS